MSTDSDELASVQRSADMTVTQMHANIDLALQRDTKLSDMKEQADDLEDTAGIFQKRTQQVETVKYWEMIKSKTCLYITVALIFFFLFGWLILRLF